MFDCAASIPREARGPAPRLEGQVLVGIKDHKITVASATMQLRDVVGASVDPTKACIEQKSVGLQVNAPDQADMETYTINITFAMPVNATGSRLRNATRTASGSVTQSRAMRPKDRSRP